MAIDWSAVKAVKIPEGDCKRVAINGTVVWEKGGLPSEYQQVEYIESNGTQYIDTNFYFEKNDIIKCKFVPTNIREDRCIFGCFRRGQQVELGVLNGSMRFDVKFITPIQKDKIYTVEKNGAKWFVDNVEQNGIGENNTNTTHTNLIFGRWCEGISKLSKCKIYLYSQYRNNECILNFVPCYRKSDGEIGMYDLVNGVFYANSGSGTFIKGEDV